MRGYRISEKETWRRCLGCKHLAGDTTCGYHLTGRTRLSQGVKGSPCELFDGKGRKKQLERAERKRRRSENRRIYPVEKIRALYEQGLRDTEIARTMGCSLSIICDWRNRENLPKNKKPGGPEALRAVYEEKAAALYYQGMPDRKIANILGGGRWDARRWRERHGLAANNGKVPGKGPGQERQGDAEADIPGREGNHAAGLHAPAGGGEQIGGIES